MRNMIKKKYACILLLLLAIGSGCSDWLDVRPRNEMKEDDMYTNEEGFKSALTGAYIQLAAKELYGRDASMYLPEMLAQHWTISTDKTSLIYNICAFDYTHEKSEEAIEKLQPILRLEGSNEEKLTRLQEILKDSETGLKGVAELSTVFRYLNQLDIQTEIKLDLTLARGLSYYTGAIFEVKAKDVEIGSITGGGRYDDLTGIFGMKNMSGVGISFGADRIFDVMNQLDIFPKDSTATTRVLFVNFGEKEEAFCLPVLKTLRNAGINSEIYPEAAKMKKQMTYADKKSIPYVALVGENEINNNVVTLKNMLTGEQESVAISSLVDKLKSEN